jgi:hypothetical protein
MGFRLRVNPILPFQASIRRRNTQLFSFDTDASNA